MPATPECRSPAHETRNAKHRKVGAEIASEVAAVHCGEPVSLDQGMGSNEEIRNQVTGSKVYRVRSSRNTFKLSCGSNNARIGIQKSGTTTLRTSPVPDFSAR
jgi:hypothetical protein